MANLGFLEVVVKKVESYSDSETASDLIHSSWTDTSYMLQIDVYDGLLIEININETESRFTEIWPKEDYEIYPSDRKPSQSLSINATIYDCEMDYLPVNLSDDVLWGMVQALNKRSTPTVMIPFPGDLISFLFNHAFKIYLNKRINAWKLELN